MLKSFDFRGKHIGYLDYGSGRPVFLIHGYLETAEIWHSFAMNLAEEGYRVIMPQLPGHGNSDLYGSVHTMEFMADTLEGLVTYLGFEKVIMAGHSMGGYVTLAFADRHGGFLSGFILFHSHPNADSAQALEKRRVEILMAERGQKDKFIPANIEKMYSADNLVSMKEAVLRSKQIASKISGPCIEAVLKGMMQRPSRLDVLESGRIPFLWILGERDNYINYPDILNGVKLPENSRSFVLRNSGHMGFIEEETMSVKLLTDFSATLL